MMQFRGISMPAAIAALPTDERGFPVPWFVAWPGGKPDFRMVEARRPLEALLRHRCWICGGALTRPFAFVIGPMCAINRVSSEPPSHVECAEFAAKACPFLANPRMVRNRKDMPEDALDAPGVHIKRNPGVCLLWVTGEMRPFKVGSGILVQVGRPRRVAWYREGREATREEAMESIRTGFPTLLAVAEEQGPDAVTELQAAFHAMMPLLPSALEAAHVG